MQRVRIGLTGLACVFLLVIFAAAFLGFVGGPHTADRKSSSIASDSTNTQAASDAPKEPLAELGVAPGNAPQKPDQHSNH